MIEAVVASIMYDLMRSCEARVSEVVDLQKDKQLDSDYNASVETVDICSWGWNDLEHVNVSTQEPEGKIFFCVVPCL